MDNTDNSYETTTTDDDTLCLNLNTLLQALQIPLTLTSPLDLTPSLLIAILESMLETRINIPQSTRLAKTYSAKVEAMKVFLGVLCDLAGEEVQGVIEVDPRRLANGSPKEVHFIGRLLVALASQNNLLPCHNDKLVTYGSSFDASVSPASSPLPLRKDPRPRPESSTPAPPVTHTSNKDGSLSNTHPFAPPDCRPPPITRSSQAPTTSESRQYHDTSTTLSHLSDVEEGEEDREEEIQSNPKQQSSTSFALKHQRNQSLPDPLDIFSPSQTQPSSSFVRRSGWIELSNDDISLPTTTAQTPNRQTTPKLPKRQPSQTPSRTSLCPTTRHNSPTQHALALLHERARLLEELAKLKLESSPSVTAGLKHDGDVPGEPLEQT